MKQKRKHVQATGTLYKFKRAQKAVIERRMRPYFVLDTGHLLIKVYSQVNYKKDRGRYGYTNDYLRTVVPISNIVCLLTLCSKKFEYHAVFLAADTTMCLNIHAIYMVWH